MTNTLDLDTLILDEGAHDSPDDGMCVMEAAAFVAGEPFSDHPECVSSVIAAFLRSWNDSLSSDDRQQLKRWVRPIIGTAGTPEQEDARAWMAIDWLVRIHTPTWLRLANLDSQAETLEALPEFRAGMDVPSIRPTIKAVRADADAAWDAAGDAAWDAARAAAQDAAWDAAGAAARAAAQAAARDAAWDAAGAAAGAAVRAAAVATGAAGAALRDALRPTVETLQASAHDLIGRMVAVTAGAES